MKRLLVIATLFIACKGSETPANVVEAGTPIANAVCQTIEGVTDNGVIKVICANIDEIGAIVNFIGNLRKASDAGALASAAPCTPVGELCATKQELAPAIDQVLRKRAAVLKKDSGL